MECGAMLEGLANGKVKAPGSLPPPRLQFMSVVQAKRPDRRAIAQSKPYGPPDLARGEIIKGAKDHCQGL